MKIVQFIHPMFLAALGLHAALMFVPVGSDAESELIEEDVPLAELTEDASRAVPSRLPALDPTVNSDAATADSTAKTATQKSAKTAAEIAANATSTGRVPPRRPAPRKVVAAGTPAQITPTGNVRPAGPTTPPTSNSSPAAPLTTNTNDVTTPVVNNPPATETPSNVNTTARNTTAGNITDAETIDTITADATTTDAATTNAATADTETVTETVDANAGLIGANSGSEAERNHTTSGTQIQGESDRLASLVEPAAKKIEAPNELRDLVLRLAQGLQYQPEGTDDAIAADMREKWIDRISPLASRATAIERIEPIVVSGQKLAYPMASSVLRKGRSLDVCLDRTPSTAEVGLLFNARGELALEPTLLRSTGYPALNTEVLELFKEAENLPSDRSSKAYIFEIGMDYDKDKCVNLDELQADEN